MFLTSKKASLFFPSKDERRDSCVHQPVERDVVRTSSRGEAFSLSVEMRDINS